MEYKLVVKTHGKVKHDREHTDLDKVLRIATDYLKRQPEVYVSISKTTVPIKGK